MRSTTDFVFEDDSAVSEADSSGEGGTDICAYLRTTVTFENGDAFG